MNAYHLHIPAELGTIRATVKAGDIFQTIDGFGVNLNPQYWNNGALTPVMDLLIDDLGASLFRVDVFGNSNWVDPDNRYDKSILTESTYSKVYGGPIFSQTWALSKYLNRRGIKPYLNASGLVPSWMLAEDGMTLKDYDSFAEMMVSMIKWASEIEQIDFEWFGPLNETDLGPPEGPRLNGLEFTKAIEVLVEKLKIHGLSEIRLVTAEQAIFNLDYVMHLLDSAEIRPYLGVIGMHTYETIRVHELASYLNARTDGSIRFWMTEYGDLDETGESEWDVAMRSTQRLLICLQDGAQAGLVWDAFDNYHDHDFAWTLYGLLRRGRHSYTPKKRFYAAKQIFRYVRPQSVRVAVECAQTEALLTAFLHPEDGLSIVGINSRATPIEIQVHFEDCNPAAFELYITNPHLHCQSMGLYQADKSLRAVIPENSIFTFKERKSAP
ncbi:hypothetical protein ACFPPD_22805 [Cohnella suwonensis]|uniref:Uncharacterized protein n=1 Tax=Cohnella suwonensis TaxID=696072 RepID=A0ABW0M045_9BACL